MKNIVFILTTLDSHARHRVDEFVSHGFDVEVYAFTRSNEKQDADAPWKVEIVGNFPNSLAYRKRFPIFFRGIRTVAERYKGKRNICFYYLGLDVAMIATFLIKHPYIYEECDLIHTRIGNPTIRNLFEKLDRRIILRSLHTVFTSEGFLSYHGMKDTVNVSVIANKLPANIMDCTLHQERKTDVSHLSFGFAGSVRYYSIISFASILLKNFPQHEFHFFGNIQKEHTAAARELEKFPNCHFHGRFSSPGDLPDIYSQLDFTLATYDTRLENVRYAEPNKLYEAVYFRTPIIVSSGTFLAEKTLRQKIGFAVDALNEKDVLSFVGSLTENAIAKAKMDIESIPLEYAIDNNDNFYNELKLL